MFILLADSKLFPIVGAAIGKERRSNGTYICIFVVYMNITHPKFQCLKKKGNLCISPQTISNLY